MKKPKKTIKVGGMTVEVGTKSKPAKEAQPPRVPRSAPPAPPAGALVPRRSRAKEDAIARRELPAVLRPRKASKRTTSKRTHCTHEALARVAIGALAGVARTTADALASHGHAPALARQASPYAAVPAAPKGATSKGRKRRAAAPKRPAAPPKRSAPKKTKRAAEPKKPAATPKKTKRAKRAK